MKPATAAKKLGVHLDATPAEFREGVISRDELDALQADPPAWLRELRRDGPHPRPVVADRSVCRSPVWPGPTSPSR
jgi:hypothetical protein